ncbi:MAG: (4Fe-4S)-binding protein [Gemmatimonadetes bacterium]|nr:(4Fe-4S)-binding protein [Gemmatimonadota bacterium]
MTSDESPEPVHEYPTPTLTVEWRPNRCIHSGVCVRSLPLVFDPRRRPWIDMSAADTEAIADAVSHCPSGALQMRR